MTDTASKFPETAAEEIADRIDVLRRRAEANRLAASEARQQVAEQDKTAARLDAIADDYERLVQ